MKIGWLVALAWVAEAGAVGAELKGTDGGDGGVKNVALSKPYISSLRYEMTDANALGPF
jgi:hypothetical protein